MKESGEKVGGGGEGGVRGLRKINRYLNTYFSIKVKCFTSDMFY